MSEDILVITTGEKRCYWYLVGRARKAAKRSAIQGTASSPPHAHKTRNFPAQNVKSTEVARPQAQGGDGGKLRHSGECPPPTGAAALGAHSEVGRMPSAPLRPKCTLGAGDLAAAPKLGARVNNYLQHDQQD